MVNKHTNHSPDTRPRFFYGYVVVIAASFVMLAASGASQIFSVFFKPLLEEFGWTRAATSGAFFLHSAISGVLRVAAGRLNDRFGPRLVITICTLFLGLGYLLMSQIQTMWHLYLFYGVVLGMGISGQMVPVVSTVARWFVKKRGLMTGIVTSTSGLSQAIMPLLVSHFIVACGWRISCIIVAIITLVPTISGAQFLRRNPAQMGQLPYGASKVETKDVTSKTEGLSLWEAIHTRQFWLFFTITITSALGSGVIMVHIVAHATDLGMSVTSAANILAFIGGLGIAGRIIMGSAADRIGAKLGLVINFTLHAVALFLVVGAKEAWMLYLFGAIFGFGMGGFIPVHSLIIADLFGLGSHGVLFGLTMLGVTVGLGVGSFLAGRIFDITGSYSWAFLISAVAMVIAVILSLLLKPARKTGKANES
jgi:MFS family permease